MFWRCSKDAAKSYLDAAKSSQDASNALVRLQKLSWRCQKLSRRCQKLSWGCKSSQDTAKSSQDATKALMTLPKALMTLPKALMTLPKAPKTIQKLESRFTGSRGFLMYIPPRPGSGFVKVSFVDTIGNESLTGRGSNLRSSCSATFALPISYLGSVWRGPWGGPGPRQRGRLASAVWL